MKGKAKKSIWPDASEERFHLEDIIIDKEMKKKVLRLTLKKKWYNLILLGAKREEYREIKEYWLKRLFEVQSPMIAKFIFGNVGLTPKDFTHIQFRLGYRKNAPTMEFQITDIGINRGDSSMGAPVDQDVIIIKFK